MIHHAFEEFVRRGVSCLLGWRPMPQAISSSVICYLVLLLGSLAQRSAGGSLEVLYYTLLMAMLEYGYLMYETNRLRLYFAETINAVVDQCGWLHPHMRANLRVVSMWQHLEP